MVRIAVHAAGMRIMSVPIVMRITAGAGRYGIKMANSGLKRAYSRLGAALWRNAKTQNGVWAVLVGNEGSTHRLEENENI